jgi:hypothetical protein
MHFGSANVGLHCRFKMHDVQNRECLQRGNAFRSPFLGGGTLGCGKGRCERIEKLEQQKCVTGKGNRISIFYPHPKCIPTLHWPLETLRQAFSEYRTAMQNAYACPFGLAIGVRLTAFTMS